jgi:hypothetical protein
VAAQQEALTNARARSSALAALVSHTEGFYDEIDKLANRTRRETLTRRPADNQSGDHQPSGSMPDSARVAGLM